MSFQKVFPILAVAAIAGFVYWSFFGGPPPRERSPQEGAALRAVEAIIDAEQKYKEQYSEYADRLHKLGPPRIQGASPDREASGLLSRDIAFGSDRLGYKLALRGYGDTFELTANPFGPSAVPRASFFADQTGVIRESLDGQATEASPKLVR
ncbi:MAG: hypothetical protein H6509_06650 [Bryobacterales bacterium]|nr:hypothetical protein [Acidobacteriota bacterium]MCB9384275.1 hypothetical protein [Bryobacterales bacterium]